MHVKGDKIILYIIFFCMSRKIFRGREHREHPKLKELIVHLNILII